MSNNFEEIIIEEMGKNACCFSLYKDDVEFRGIVKCNFLIYGIPSECSEMDKEEIYGGDYKKAILLGNVRGSLILCNYILDKGGEPYEACDADSAELEYVMSALKEGPLSEEWNDIFQDVFYIDEIYIDEKYKKGIATKVAGDMLNELYGEKSDNDNLTAEGKEYQLYLDEEQINYLAGKRTSGVSYPESAKIKEIWDFYESFGYEEIGNSRLLYKKIR